MHRGEQGRCGSSVDVRCCHLWEWRRTCLSLVFRLTETTHSGKVWEAESSLSASSRSLALTRSQEPIYTEDLMVSLLLSASGHGCSWSQEWRELSSSSNLSFMWGRTYTIDVWSGAAVGGICLTLLTAWDNDGSRIHMKLLPHGCFCFCRVLVPLWTLPHAVAWTQPALWDR